MMDGLRFEEFTGINFVNRKVSILGKLNYNCGGWEVK